MITQDMFNRMSVAEKAAMADRDPKWTELLEREWMRTDERLIQCMRSGGYTDRYIYELLENFA